MKNGTCRSSQEYEILFKARQDARRHCVARRGSERRVERNARFAARVRAAGLGAGGVGMQADAERTVQIDRASYASEESARILGDETWREEVFYIPLSRECVVLCFM